MHNRLTVAMLNDAVSHEFTCGKVVCFSSKYSVSFVALQLEITCFTSIYWYQCRNFKPFDCAKQNMQQEVPVFTLSENSLRAKCISMTRWIIIKRATVLHWSSKSNSVHGATWNTTQLTLPLTSQTTMFWHKAFWPSQHIPAVVWKFNHIVWISVHLGVHYHFE
jgi:hypothetical protein